MIAIAVFAIGVIAVLRLITQNLVTLDLTQSRTTATFLAKEWLELVYNMRDSNIAKGLTWDCVLKKEFTAGVWNDVIGPDDVCAWNFSSWLQDHKVLQISFDPAGYTFTKTLPLANNFMDIWSGNRLSYASWVVGGHTIFWYSSVPVQWTSPWFFARYLVFTGVREGETQISADRILKVESHVLYNKWTKTWEVVLESFIWNY